MPAPTHSQIASIRRFNRFYTREVGVLRKNFLDTPWSLAEMRVLFEIANGADVTASDIGKALDLDAAYLSRMLQKFEKDGLVSRTRSKADARVSFLGLSVRGKKQFAAANERQVAQTKNRRKDQWSSQQSVAFVWGHVFAPTKNQGKISGLRRT